MKKSQGFGSVYVLAVIVVIIVVFAGTIAYRHNHNQKLVASNKTKQSTTTKKQSTQTTDPYAGWVAYCDSTVKGCIKYPSDWSVSQYGGFTNSSQTAYASLAGPTVKDGGSAMAYVATADTLNSANTDLKVLGLVVDNKPIYIVYPATYVDSNDLKPGETKNIGYANYRFQGKYSDMSLVATPGANGSAAITSADQAKTWFNSADGQTCLKVLQSFYYQ